MGNNLIKNLFISIVLSIILVLILLCFYYFDSENRILKILIQGEVIAGIVIALPTLVTWINSIYVQKFIDNRRISENAMEIVKYYDNKLSDIVEDIKKNKSLELHNSLKLEYIISTFDKLFEEWGADKSTNISLNYSQILPVICDLEYPKNIEKPSEDGDLWKNNLAIALRPILANIIKTDKTEVLQLTPVKYFSMITFGEENLRLKNIEFKSKHFVECTFTKEFLEYNNFYDCKFINCSSSNINKDDLSKIDIHKSNKVIDFRDCEGELFLFYNEDNINNSFNVIDNREVILVNKYIYQNKFYEVDTIDIGDKPIKSYIVNKIFSGEESTKYNNKKVSISKNYIENKKNKEIKWSGWHSLFEKNIEKANNFKYYIFAVGGENNVYYVVVFEVDKFKDYIKRKKIDKSGKYNFYFANFMKENNGNL